jgi:hypothetical protein
LNDIFHQDESVGIDGGVVGICSLEGSGGFAAVYSDGSLCFVHSDGGREDVVPREELEAKLAGPIAAQPQEHDTSAPAGMIASGGGAVVWSAGAGAVALHDQEGLVVGRLATGALATGALATDGSLVALVGTETVRLWRARDRRPQRKARTTSALDAAAAAAAAAAAVTPAVSARGKGQNQQPSGGKEAREAALREAAALAAKEAALARGPSFSELFTFHRVREGERELEDPVPLDAAGPAAAAVPASGRAKKTASDEAAGKKKESAEEREKEEARLAQLAREKAEREFARLAARGVERPGVVALLAGLRGETVVAVCFPGSRTVSLLPIPAEHGAAPMKLISLPTASPVASMAMHPSRFLAVIAHEDSTVSLFDARTMSLRSPLVHPLPARITAIAFSGPHVACALECADIVLFHPDRSPQNFTTVRAAPRITALVPLDANRVAVVTDARDDLLVLYHRGLHGGLSARVAESKPRPNKGDPVPVPVPVPAPVVGRMVAGGSGLLAWAYLEAESEQEREARHREWRAKAKVQQEKARVEREAALAAEAKGPKKGAAASSSKRPTSPGGDPAPGALQHPHPRDELPEPPEALPKALRVHIVQSGGIPEPPAGPGEAEQEAEELGGEGASLLTKRSATHRTSNPQLFTHTSLPLSVQLGKTHMTVKEKEAYRSEERARREREEERARKELEAERARAAKREELQRLHRENERNTDPSDPRSRVGARARAERELADRAASRAEREKKLQIQVT